MPLFRATTVRPFYNSFKNKSVWNPARRWVYHKLLGVVTVGVVGATTISYQSCGGVGNSHDDHLCGPWTLQLLEFLPLGWISSYFGAFACSAAWSHDTHQEFIRRYISWYEVDMSDVDGDVESFDTLESFFIRSLKPGSRPVVDKDHVWLSSPVDGIVLSVADVEVGASSSKVVHVKGAQYTLQNLLRTSIPVLPQDHERKVVTLLMRAKDYHHVHAPCDMRVEESVVIPGNLFPMTLRGFRWIANIVSTNERVCFRCLQLSGDDGPRPLWMALIGGVVQGKIDVRFDARIHTNLADPPQYAIHLPYADTPRERKLLSAGDDIARFRWGSAVVVVVDVPKGASSWRVKVMDEVRVGAPLLAKV